MRASFLLVLALALLVGLGVAVAVRTMGLLTPAAIPQPVVVKEVPPPPAPTPPPPPPPSLLVATRNFYEGDTIRNGDVRVRAARPDEIKTYEANKSDYMPATTDSAQYRFASRNVEADSPLKRSDLKELAKPESLNARLAPGTRAVNVSASKDDSAGGLIAVTDWVDVYLTTDVGRSDEPGRAPHTALIARAVQVIAKRDTLWTIFAPLPVGQDIQYTLAANPYRAAVLEYARTVGKLAIVPVSANEKSILDDRKKAVMADPSKALTLSVANVNSPEFKDEEQRVGEYDKGKLTIGSDDLIRILNLKPIQPPAPPPPAPPAPPPPIKVEVYQGVNKLPAATFPVDAPAPPPPTPKVVEPAKYVFAVPAAKPAEKPPAATVRR